jgi:hypothetical protein
MKASIQRNAIVALSVFCVAIMGNGQLLAQASQAPANTGNFAKLTAAAQRRRHDTTCRDKRKQKYR